MAEKILCLRLKTSIIWVKALLMRKKAFVKDF